MDRFASLAGALLLVSSCTPTTPRSEALRVQGSLERNLDGSGGALAVDFDDATSRGEWWPCDARLTASTCIDGRHVNVFVSPPEAASLDDVGQASCVSTDGPFGAFEILSRKFAERAPVDIPGDAAVFVLVASDGNGDGSAGLDDDAETSAVARIAQGTLTIGGLSSFDAPLSLVLDGTTVGGHDVHIEFLGPMSNPSVVPPLDDAGSCVAPE